MPFNLLLLPLLGGYWFTIHWNRTRYLATRLSRERLLFLAATFGLILLASSYLITRILIHTHPEWALVWKDEVPWPFSGTAFGSLVLGFAAPFALNLWFDKDKENVLAIQKYGDSLELFFCSATNYQQLVMITTDSGKVYVGYSKKIPPLHTSDSYIQIMPVQSGYRDKDTHKVELTTNYSEVYQAIIVKFRANTQRIPENILDDFIKVIPIASIKSVGLFDPDAYVRFSSSNNPKTPPPPSQYSLFDQGG